MVTDYKGRKISIVRGRDRYSNKTWRVRIEGQEYLTYPRYQYAEPEAILPMICATLDLVDADDKIGWGWFMYAKTDPRRQKVLDHMSGKQPMTDKERGMVRVGFSDVPM